MRAAFAVWDQRIAPVFDVTRRVHIVEAQGGRVVEELDQTLPDGMPAQRALRLAELGVDALICGAVSRSMQALIVSYGISVRAFVAGELNDVVEAWLTSRLDSPAYAMPGCRRGRRRRRSGCGAEPEERRRPCQEETGRDPGDRAR